MNRKLKLHALEVKSFRTLNRQSADRLQGGYGVLTDWTCPETDSDSSDVDPPHPTSYKDC